MSEHTPTPWYACGTSVLLEREGFEMLVRVARMDSRSGKITRKQAEANALFVARACNSHDALLAACLDAERAFRVPAGIEPEREVAALATLRAAIAKAEGR